MKIYEFDLIKETKIVFSSKKKLIIGLFIYSIIQSIYYNMQLLPSSMDTNNSVSIFRNFSLIQIVLSIFSFILFFYLIQYLVVKNNAQIISFKRFIRFFKELPNIFLTSIFIIIRIFPIYLLALLACIPFIVISVVTKSHSDMIINTMISLITVIFLWGYIRVSIIIYISLTTKNRYWKSTKVGIQIYKANKIIFLKLAIPFVVMIFLLLLNNVFLSSNQFIDNITSIKIYGVASIILFSIYSIIYASIIRIIIPQDEITAE